MEAVDLDEVHNDVKVFTTTTTITVYALLHRPRVQTKDAERRKPCVHLFSQKCLVRYLWATASSASTLLDKVLRRVAMRCRHAAQ